MAGQKNIRPRAVVLGVLLGLGVCAVTPYNNMLLRATLLGGGHFPLAPFVILFWLTVITTAAGKLTRRSLLAGRELFVTWILMVLVSGLPYTGLVRTFFVNITTPQTFATPNNHWAETLGPLLPASLFPKDPKALTDIYDGLDGALGQNSLTVLSRIDWSAWAGPLLWWGAFVFLAFLVMICLVNLFSGQWVENERVNFPLLRLPQVMEEAVDEGRFLGFLTDRYLLIGLALTVFLHTMNGLSSFYPEIPQIPTLFVVGKYFSKYGIFSGFHKLKIYIYPAFIGFAFLTSRQISLSLWFFYLLGALAFGVLDVTGLSVPAGALGVTFGPTLAAVEETQMIGAYGVFFLFLLWLARSHLAMIARHAVGIGQAKRGESEWFSLRAAFWGGIGGMVLLGAWCVHFGMTPLAAASVLVMFFVVSFVAARIICQGGIAYFTLTAAPLDGLIALFGSGFLGTAGLLVAAAAQKVLFVDLRESLLPSLFHAAKVGEGVRNKRLYLTGIVVVLILGVAVSIAAMMALCHTYGLRELELEWATRTSVSVYDNVKRLIDTPLSMQGHVVTYSLVGAAIMLALVLCYHRFHWWPLHPIGYLATYSSSMHILWFSFFVGWLVNQVCLRYGGVTLFRKVRYFFFGLILGDFLMGGMWAMIGLHTGMTYQVLPD
ncbi:hypothetical protein dsx2_1874 [Desulfovibrio sp. X2]|uniref:DUF6785 family protein n=1 Tax=Desulfovibrio sp. X2 TaxID=941449 RepID=UPI000358E891|nr:DUF6785 family protein [Desulfovibrio sp. X2]EPR44130.1 hypothetical protein dsx2_1874 [Desulfovibrio sp. X2]